MIALALFLAAAPVVDVDSHSVAFDVVSTDPGLGTDIEFLVAGPDSDHDYEAMFLTENSVAELCDAFKRAGFPAGDPIDYRKCRFWPVGDDVAFEPDIWSFITDTRDERKAPVLFTGGTKGPDGVPEAHTNMPQAVFALYDCPQSIFQFDDSLGQSVTYGRFRPAVKIAKGEKRTLKVTWKGRTLHKKLVLRLEPGAGVTNAIATLRRESGDDAELDVTTVFSPDMTVAEAQGCAAALQLLDSPSVKFNGFADGQFFFRAFMPLERWRDRTERLTQPYEVSIAPDGKFSLTVIKEDWTTKTDSTDPILIVKENVDFASLATSQGAQPDTCLIFAQKSTRLADVFAVRKLLPPSVSNFYVYGD